MINDLDNPKEERPEWSDEDTRPNRPIDIDDVPPLEEAEEPAADEFIAPPDGPPIQHNPIHPEIPPMGSELPK